MTTSARIMAKINETAIEKGRELTPEEQERIWIEYGLCPECGQEIGFEETCETCRDYNRGQSDELAIDVAAGR